MARKMEENEVVNLISGTIEEVKETVEKKDLSKDELNRILKDEKAAKNRKQVKNFLKSLIKNKKINEDIRIAEKDIEDIKDSLDDIKKHRLGNKEYEYEKKDIDYMTEVDLIEGPVKDMIEFVEKNDLNKKQMEEVLEAEKRAKDRKTAKQYLKSRIKNKKLYKDIKDAKNAIRQLGEDLEEIKGYKEYTPAEEELINKTNIEDRTSREEKLLREHGYNDQKIKDKSDKEIQEAAEKLEKKLEILEQLETDLEDEKINEITVKELKNLKKEKRERKKLIEKLDRQGIDKDKLDSSTNEDLKKLAADLDSSDEEEKTREQIEEEAEEEVEMLRGAISKSTKEKEDKESPIEKIEGLKQKAEEAIEREENNQQKDLPSEKVLETLEKYQSIESDREKAIKTAHLMKAFLESRLHINRELTYTELAENLQPGKNDQKIKLMKKFFEKMGKDQYKGGISIKKFDKVLEVSRKLVEELENGAA